jgi:DNA-binding GntR family transcriptional regulator
MAKTTQSNYRKKDPNGSPRARAFEMIRDGIFRGKLLPGDALKELHLARELGVSQSTVREALIRLEHVGLVVRIPNSETRVTNLSRQELKERLEVRATLEELAFAEAMAAVDDSFFARLEELLEAIAAAAARQNPFELAEKDFDFHRFIWHHSGNEILSRTLEQVSAPLFASVGLLRSRGEPQKLETAVGQHQSIIDAFRTGDEQVVKENIRNHAFRFQGQFFGIRVSDMLMHPATLGA